jgi:mono/diheme cytochrome c family protein
MILPACGLALIQLTACRQDMHNQPRYKPMAASRFFADGLSARPAVEGTVPREHLRADEEFYTGKSGTNFVTTLPFPVTRQVVERGQTRFDIYCSPCHGRLGDGEGMVVQRGFRHPPSFHIDRLREAPVGQFFDTITNGFGAMASYASRIPPRDRWAIVAYVRALQLSQQARLDDVPAAERQQLEEAPQ